MDKAFYGSVTVGERGQIVIPAEAREELGIAPGEKLLAMRHPVHEGIVLFKLECAREFIDEFRAKLERAAEAIAAEEMDTQESK